MRRTHPNHAPVEKVTPFPPWSNPGTATEEWNFFKVLLWYMYIES